MGSSASPPSDHGAAVGSSSATRTASPSTSTPPTDPPLAVRLPPLDPRYGSNDEQTKLESLLLSHTTRGTGRSHQGRRFVLCLTRDTSHRRRRRRLDRR